MLYSYTYSIILPEVQVLPYFRELARTLLYVFFVTSTFFRWLFSNYVEEYLKLRQFTLIQGLKGVGQ